jgi:hypothetical protein
VVAGLVAEVEAAGVCPDALGAASGVAGAWAIAELDAADTRPSTIAAINDPYGRRIIPSIPSIGR